MHRLADLSFKSKGKVVLLRKLGKSGAKLALIFILSGCGTSARMQAVPSDKFSSRPVKSFRVSSGLAQGL